MAKRTPFSIELARLLRRPEGATLQELDAAAHRYGAPRTVTYSVSWLRLTARMEGWRLWHLDDERQGVERAYRISSGGEKFIVQVARSGAIFEQIRESVRGEA